MQKFTTELRTKVKPYVERFKLVKNYSVNKLLPRAVEHATYYDYLTTYQRRNYDYTISTTLRSTVAFGVRRTTRAKQITTYQLITAIIFQKLNNSHLRVRHHQNKQLFFFYHKRTFFIHDFTCYWASAMVTSTSTPGSILIEVICFTISDGLCRSIRRLWIRIW